MGWCSGTEVFDSFCESFFNPKTKNAHEILVRIIDTLESLDWDCQMDSAYWDKPAVRAAFMELHPEWFDEDCK